MLRKSKIVFMVSIIAIFTIIGTVTFAAETATVLLDGSPLSFDVEPQIINGRTMVPMRKIFEAMGAEIHWHEEKQYVVANTDFCQVVATINDPVMTVNSTPKTMDVAPILKNGRTLVPARFVAEAFGAKVEWDESTSTVNITSPELPTFIPKWDIYLEGYTSSYIPAGMTNMFAVSSYATRYIQVPTKDVEFYKNLCWYTEQMIVMYAADGRTIVVPEAEKDEYKKVGWFASKNEIDLVGNRNKIPSLLYDSSRTGSITGTITYQYNDFIGTRPDVDADVMLIQTNHIPLDSDRFNISLYDNKDDPMIYCTKVDGLGNYYLDNIPAGEYYLIIESSDVYEDPSLAAWNVSIIEMYLTGKITDDALSYLTNSAGFLCFVTEKIEIKQNQTFRYSEDWGYSYF